MLKANMPAVRVSQANMAQEMQILEDTLNTDPSSSRLPHHPVNPTNPRLAQHEAAGLN
jgi:hypothetical protein